MTPNTYTLHPGWSHPEDLDDGRRIAPGETLEGVDVDVVTAPRGYRLLESGGLLPHDAAAPGGPLEDPSAHLVDDVIAALAKHPEEADRVKALEAAGRDRTTIKDWAPTPAEEAA